MSQCFGWFFMLRKPPLCFCFQVDSFLKIFSSSFWFQRKIRNYLWLNLTQLYSQIILSPPSQPIPKLRMNPSCSPSVCPGPARLPKDLFGRVRGRGCCSSVTKNHRGERVGTSLGNPEIEGMLWLQVKFVVECCIMWTVCPVRGLGFWRFLLRLWEVAVLDLGAVENDAA